MRERERERRIHFVPNGEVEESEEGGLVGLGGVTDSEHGGEWSDRVGKQPTASLRGLGEASDFSGALQLQIQVVGLDEE